MAEAVSGALERLNIHGDDAGGKEDADAGPSVSVADEAPEPTAAVTADESPSSQILASSASTIIDPPILICDAWYGFPTQKRPRKERIYAVSRQLSNFLEWQSEGPNSQRDSCRVSLLGAEGDVQAVQDRVTELASKSQSTTGKETNAASYQSNITIHEFLEQQPKEKYDPNDGITEVEEEAVYLSPDASYTLPSTSPPPRMAIIGMLIDRRITTDRSRVRAEETLKIKAAKLPLDELNVKELTSQEPLNVDTVMELMQRWWWNCDRAKQHFEKAKNGESKVPSDVVYKKCFLEAAAWAMKTQRERHPNRTVHNATKKK